MASGLICREGEARSHKEKTWIEQEIATKLYAAAETGQWNGSLT